MSKSIKSSLLTAAVLLTFMATASNSWAQFSGNRGFRIPSVSPRGIAGRILNQQVFGQQGDSQRSYRQQPGCNQQPQPEYSQPAYSQPVYSQPVYTQPTQSAQPPAAPTPIELARKYTADAKTLFQQGNYAEAERRLDEVVKRVPKDSNAYQFRALANFAQNDFEAAAADAYDAMALGNSWTQDVIKSIYGPQRIRVYNNHLAQLSNAVELKPTMQSHFLSAYYNLVNGNWSAGKTQLEKVLVLQPEEKLSQKLLAAVNAKLASDQKAVATTN